MTVYVPSGRVPPSGIVSVEPSTTGAPDTITAPGSSTRAEPPTSETGSLNRSTTAAGVSSTTAPSAGVITCSSAWAANATVAPQPAADEDDEQDDDEAPHRAARRHAIVCPNASRTTRSSCPLSTAPVWLADRLHGVRPPGRSVPAAVCGTCHPIGR